jgi:transcriptional regulator with XRE-family HTH domain
VSRNTLDLLSGDRYALFVMTAEVQSLSAAIGRELKTLREAGGLRQEQLAAEARRFGLAWTRATVAAIELGRRQLSIGELVLLPELLGHAGAGWGYDVSDLIPADERPVLVAGGITAPASAVRARFADTDEDPDERAARLTAAEFTPPRPHEMPAATTLPRAWLLDVLRVPRLEDVPGRVWTQVELEAAGDAERKAAAGIGVLGGPLAVALAARRRWSRSLTAQRDRLVGFRTDPMLRADPAAARDPGWPRRLQAIRGHVTRELLDELRPLLKDITMKRKAKRSTKRRAR